MCINHIVLPYSWFNINNYLHLYMINQNQFLHYISTGLNEYYIEILTNITYYSNQIVCKPIPFVFT